MGKMILANAAAIDPKHWLMAHEPSGASNAVIPFLELGGEAIEASGGCVATAIMGFPDLSVEITLAYLLKDQRISDSTRKKILWLGKAVERKRNV